MRGKDLHYLAPLVFLLLAVAFAAALMTAGGKATGDTDTPTAAPTPEPPADTLELQGGVTEDWSNEGFFDTVTLLNIGLDKQTQWNIYAVCDFDPRLYCTVMAIAYRETGGTFQADAIGDNGGSVGMFQINVKWHTDRMERLGVTDLMDPVQCAAVAADYILELVERYGFQPESEGLLMAYNMGPSGARKAQEGGITSTAYSFEVITVFRGYLEEMEAAE